MPMLSRAKKAKKVRRILDDTQELNSTLNYTLEDNKTPTRPTENEATKPSESASFNFATPGNSNEEEQDDKFFMSLEEEIEKSTQSSSIFDIPQMRDAYLEYARQLPRPPSPFPEECTQETKLRWLYEHRNTGVYVLCDKCDKMRYLEDVVDPLELTEKWYCYMNADVTKNKCNIPEDEVPTGVMLELVNNKYNAGSIVYAKIEGYPWWPAMVDDDPDLYMFYWLEEMSDDPTYYHVTFFDSETVTRAWVKPNAIVSFKAVEDGSENINCKMSALDRKLYKHRLSEARAEARKALSMSLIDRLHKYNFTARFKASRGGKKRVTAKKSEKQEKKKQRKVESKKAEKDSSAMNVVSEKTAKKSNKTNIKAKMQMQVQNEKKDSLVLKSQNKLSKAQKKLDEELEKFVEEMGQPKKRKVASKGTQEKSKKASVKPKKNSKKFRIDSFTFENAENILTPELFTDEDSSNSNLSDLVIDMF